MQCDYKAIHKEHLKQHVKSTHNLINEPTITDFIKRLRLRQEKEASKETIEKYTGAGLDDTKF